MVLALVVVDLPAPIPVAAELLFQLPVAAEQLAQVPDAVQVPWPVESQRLVLANLLASADQPEAVCPAS